MLCQLYQNVFLVCLECTSFNFGIVPQTLLAMPNGIIGIFSDSASVSSLFVMHLNQVCILVDVNHNFMIPWEMILIIIMHDFVLNSVFASDNCVFFVGWLRAVYRRYTVVVVSKICSSWRNLLYVVSNSDVQFDAINVHSIDLNSFLNVCFCATN